jgi:hypothetical protein
MSTARSTRSSSQSISSSPTGVFGWTRSIRRPAATPGRCAFASETDPAVLRILLKVQDGAGGGYLWVTCGGCDMGWQVPYYPESVG